MELPIFFFICAVGGAAMLDMWTQETRVYIYHEDDPETLDEVV